MPRVTNEAILNLLRGIAPEALTNAEIRDALDCNHEEAHYISPRVRGMVLRQKRTGIHVTMKGDRLAWYYKETV